MINISLRDNIVIAIKITLNTLKVLTGHNNEGDVLGDYCDGTLFKQHPLFSREHRTLQIIFNYELEVCNPLGTSAKIHKIGKSGLKRYSVC